MLRLLSARGIRALVQGGQRTDASSIRCRGFAEAAATKPATDANKVNFNFFLPHEAIHRGASVDMVIVPAAGGVMGILPQHVPTVAQLRAGLVEVHNEGETQKYFVSSGFCFVHKDRTDLCAVEAVKIDDVDPDAVSKGLADCEGKVSSAKDDLEKAEAQIGIDLYTSLQNAISKK